MTTIDIHDDRITITFSLFETIFALRHKLEIPLAHIQDVVAEDRSLPRLYWAIRAPGTYVPGLIIAGTYYKDRERIFWNVRRGQEVVTIELSDAEKYDRLILGVDDAAEAIHTIKRRM